MTCCLLWIISLGTAQENTQVLDPAVLVGVSYAAQWPGGDLTDRFGGNFSAGLQVDYLTAPNNWLFGLIGTFQFGSTVKTDVLASLRTAEGLIIATDRSPANIALRERGIFLGAYIGKILPLSERTVRSGLRLELGAGLLQHQIRIQEDPVRVVAQLTGDYRKGYDRLTNGAALRQFIGYNLMSNDGRINFYAGLEVIEGFTRSRRDFDFFTRMRDQAPRFDLLYGVRVGWILPFFINRNPEEIFY